MAPGAVFCEPAGAGRHAAGDGFCDVAAGAAGGGLGVGLAKGRYSLYGKRAVCHRVLVVVTGFCRLRVLSWILCYGGASGQSRSGIAEGEEYLDAITLSRGGALGFETRGLSPGQTQDGSILSSS